jgi:hypothetical protein
VFPDHRRLIQAPDAGGAATDPIARAGGKVEGLSAGDQATIAADGGGRRSRADADRGVPFFERAGRALEVGLVGGDSTGLECQSASNASKRIAASRSGPPMGCMSCPSSSPAA